MYKDQRMCIRWDGSFSDRFRISNGVQQGGVLSLIMFTIYVYDLLEDLSKLGIGCYWDSPLCWLCMYAMQMIWYCLHLPLQL